jgi:hypothetical protein
MAFKGRDPVRTKIVTDSKNGEKLKSFKYFRNMIFYDRELDIEKKNNYSKNTGVLVFRPQKALKEKFIQYTGPASVVIW